MPALSEHSNVYNTALLIAKAKGFRLWFDERYELYCAEKDGWDFWADSPASLLGLIAIYEVKTPTSFKDYWWKEDGPEIYHSLSRTPPDYCPIWKKK